VRAEIAAGAKAGLLAVDATLPVQEDANAAFDRPDNRAWARISFQDGFRRFETLGGEGGNLERGPALAFIDIFVPLDSGDGDLVALVEGAKNGVRRLDVPGARFQRFDQGPEGQVDGQFRKQIVAVFLASQRV
jgi:hypothetical protein